MWEDGLDIEKGPRILPWEKISSAYVISMLSNEWCEYIFMFPKIQHDNSHVHSAAKILALQGCGLQMNVHGV